MLIPIGQEVSMDPLTALLVPGLVGGVVMAIWIAFTGRRPHPDSLPYPSDPGELLDGINMANIRVAGLGGLGMVAGAVVVAVFVPSVGVSIGAAVAAGALLAVGLILWRRRSGPLTSSGQRPGASTMLAIESRPATAERAPNEDGQGPAGLKSVLRPI